MIGVFKKQLGWWLLLPTCLAFWTKYTVEYDAMRVARCYSKCDRYPSINQCMEICLSENFTKPGKCPTENSMSPFESVCLIACTNDSQCTDLGKCCSNDCGITCMNPTGLSDHLDLPPIPEIIVIRREKSNMVTLNWKPKELIPKQDGEVCWYLVEERHVLGPRYSESRLTSWAVLHMGSKPFPSIKAGLKTGHWYQFRVAVVNQKGSRGYSVPSKPFKTAEPRNPREPRNLSLSGARVQPEDGKLRILLRWRQPPSDVPIMFYKLFWSQLIVGPTNESVIISHRSISKDKNCFEIKNLEIGWQYFLQVQAVSVYGGRRIMSKQVSKVFNSTDYRDYEGHSERCERQHLGLRVRRLICQCSEEVDARLVWPVDEEAATYNVSWRLESCSVYKNSRNSKITPNLISPTTLSQLTQKTRFDIKNLEKNCTYSVNVRSIFNINNNNNNNDNNNNKNDNNELGGPTDDNWPTEDNEERNLSIELTTNISCNKIRQNRHNNSNNNNNNNNNNDSNNSNFKVSKCHKRKTRLKKIYNKFY